jgi:hypothetical protein
MRESQALTQEAGFHSANAALDFQQQTFEALANLATATEWDRSAVSNLTGTNSALTIQLATTNAKLDTAFASNLRQVEPPIAAATSTAMAIGATTTTTTTPALQPLGSTLTKTTVGPTAITSTETTPVKPAVDPKLDTKK